MAETKEVFKKINHSYSATRAMLNVQNPNKTTLKYL